MLVDINTFNFNMGFATQMLVMFFGCDNLCCSHMYQEVQCVGSLDPCKCSRSIISGKQQTLFNPAMLGHPCWQCTGWGADLTPKVVTPVPSLSTGTVGACKGQLELKPAAERLHAFWL